MRSSTLIRSAFALLCAVALVGCGGDGGGDGVVTGASESADPNFAASVNGTGIPASEVENRFEQAKSQPQVQQQLASDTAGVVEGQIQAQILSQLVLSEILEQWGTELGVEVTEADAAAQKDALIEQLGGQEAFDEAVAGSGLSDEDIQLQLRQRALQDKIAESVATDPEVTDEEVAAFYEENAETRFGEQARARHILVEERAVAKDLIAQLENGADFAELAKEYSKDTGSGAKGGDLGEFGRGQMVPEFDEAVFGANVDEIVGPVKTEFGFHIIEVLDLVGGKTREEATEQIRTELEETKRTEQLQTELTDRTKSTDVTVNPRFGTWNAETGQVEPNPPSGDPSGASSSPGASTEGATPEMTPPPTE